MVSDPIRAEVVLSFDNLGEAADEELGLAVPEPPHFSVVEILPQVLALLEETRLRATFFVEAINVGRYPRAVASITRAGHELGGHAWRHESWHAQPVPARKELLRRSLRESRSLGAEVTGFRPPGGLLDDEDFAMLAGLGIEWVSPAGSRAGVRDGIACLPFEWREIDAYYFAPALAPLRRADGHGVGPLPAADFERSVTGAVEAVTTSRTPEPLVLVIHPFLYTSEERTAVLATLLAELGRLRASGEAHVGPGRQAAERMRRRSDAPAPVLADTTWA